jgi:hypothetical protein
VYLRPGVQLRRHLESTTVSRSKPQVSRTHLMEQADRVTNAIAATGHNDLLTAKLSAIQRQLDDLTVPKATKAPKAELVMKNVKEFVPTSCSTYLSRSIRIQLNPRPISSNIWERSCCRPDQPEKSMSGMSAGNGTCFPRMHL